MKIGKEKAYGTGEIEKQTFESQRDRKQGFLPDRSSYS